MVSLVILSLEDPYPVGSVSFGRIRIRSMNGDIDQERIWVVKKSLKIQISLPKLQFFKRTFLLNTYE